MSRILVVASHPDDELLGVGGTLARHIDRKDKVCVLILGEGQTSRFSGREEADRSAVDSLRNDTLRADGVIGITDVEFADFPDNRFDSTDLLDIVKRVEKSVAEIRPDIIYTHHHADLNIDHRMTFQAVLTATRPIKGNTVSEIYAFETASSTEWNFGDKSAGFYPDYFVDITKYIELKCKALEHYKTEMRTLPHPRSAGYLYANAAKWGAVVGCDYAEAFEVVRIISG